jgi:putative transposase
MKGDFQNRSIVHVGTQIGFASKRLARGFLAAAQVVLIRGLAAVGHTLKMLSEGKFIAIPMTK